MHATVRPYATAGVALVGAGLIAVTPLAAPLPAFTPAAQVALTAGQTLPDLMAPWIDEFNTASENASQLANNFFLAPGVAFQQFLANQADFWSQIFNDPSNATIADVSMQMQDNLTAVLSSYSLIGATADTVNTVIQHTLDAGGGLTDITHSTIFDQIASYLPPDVSIEQIQPIINFLVSPMSGMIMGALGPAISPWIALGNSLADGDSFGEVLAHMTGAFFNGATLNLDSLLPLINDSGYLGDNTLLHLDFAFGGLLSGGSVGAEPYDVINDSGDPVSITAAGGSIFNSIGLIMASPIAPGGVIDLASQPVGPLGAWLGFQQAIADLLGWNGTAGPGIGIDFPTFPTDVVDDDSVGGMAATTLDWLPDLLTGLSS